MHALDGCRELLHVEKGGDRLRRLVRFCQDQPFRMLIVFALVPHLIGSIVNVTYNRLLILNKDVEQQDTFAWIVGGYNATVYPLGFWPPSLWSAVPPKAGCGSATIRGSHRRKPPVCAARFSRCPAGW